MRLLERVGSVDWVQGLRPVRCSHSDCSRWLTSRQLEVRRVGVIMNERWHCSYRCFRHAALKHIARLLRDSFVPQPRSAHSSLGMALLRSGLLNDDQYKLAARIERETAEDVGEVAIRLGFLSERQVTHQRATLWNCPVLSYSPSLERRGFRLPWFLTQRYAMLPLHYTASIRTLFVGFVYEVNYEALYAAELMMECSARACIITPGEFTQMAMQSTKADPLHPCRAIPYLSGADIVDAVCSSGIAINADKVRVVRCGSVLWCRLMAGKKSADLLFQAKDFMSVPRTSA